MRKRITFIREVVLWTGIYIIMVLIPLVLAIIGHQENYRGFWIEFGVGLGFIGIALMGLQFILTARFKKIAAPFGTDALLNFHRQAGYVAFIFIAGHVLVLITANTDYLSFFDPRVNSPRAMALTLVIVLLILLVALTIWRKNLKIPYEWWRISHAAFAFLILFIGLSHILMVGFYISEIWQKLLWIILTGTAMAMLVHVRIFKPYLMSKNPYKVSNVKQDKNDVWTLEIEPVDHKGMTFKAGQFAWLTIGPTPFSMQQHPFSFSSSSVQSDRYTFTIKELGDFTSTIKQIEKNTPVYIEGPYGAFTLNKEYNDVFFIIGGIGITPVISMLRTLRDQKDNRQITLLYGNTDVQSIVFLEELKQLEKELNLSVKHVLENSPDDWQGYEGFITDEMIKKYIPTEVESADYYICGPEPLMDLAEITLRNSSVPLYKIHSERFNIV